MAMFLHREFFILQRQTMKFFSRQQTPMQRKKISLPPRLWSHSPHTIFKSKYTSFQGSKIGLRSQVPTRVAVFVPSLHQDTANLKLSLCWVIASPKVVGNQLLLSSVSGKISDSKSFVGFLKSDGIKTKGTLCFNRILDLPTSFQGKQHPCW